MKDIFYKVKTINDHLKNKLKISDMFILFFPLCNILYWLLQAILHGNIIDSYFVNDYHNTGMDYFNMLSYFSADSPYDMDANYPTMCVFLLRVLYHFIPTVLRDGDGFYYRELMHAQILYIVYTTILLLATWELTKYSYNGNYIEKTLLAIGVIFSGPVLFTLERGNLIFICLPCILIFINLYNSELRWQRWCAYAALSLAASVKIYPALFGVLILHKKRYKEGILTAILGFLVFVLPCLAFGGMEAITGLLNGLRAASDLVRDRGLAYNFSFYNLIKIIYAIVGINASVPAAVKFLIPLFVCCTIFITGKEEWKKIYAISLFCIWFPDFSYTYMLMLMIPPMLCCIKNCTGYIGNIYRLCFLIILIPLCLPKMEYLDPKVKFPLTMPTLVINMAICILTVVILKENITQYNILSEKKKQIHYVHSGG